MRLDAAVVFVLALLQGFAANGSKDAESWAASASAAEATGGFLVVMDAGSTGTRAYAFSYPPRVVGASGNGYVKGLPYVMPKVLFSVKREPGISSFSNNEAGLRSHLGGLCSDVRERIAGFTESASEDVSNVPIFLGGTAGMRDLRPAQRAAVLRGVRGALADSGFYFAHSQQQAHVLAGVEEAAFGWLTANSATGYDAGDSARTFGSLDIGGESAEIAFVPETDSLMEGLFPIFHGKLSNTVRLYAHSFMHYGIVGAYQSATRALLHSRGGDGGVLEHPCMPRGLKWHVEADAFGVATDGSTTRATGPLELRGAERFDFSRCLEVAEQILYKAPCTLKPCSFLGVYQPSTANIRFLMTGGHLADLWTLFSHPPSDTPVLQYVRDRGAEFCSLSLAEQGAFMDRASYTDPAGRALACWLSVYSFAFLTRGLGFPVNATNLFVKAGVPADWPMGAAVYYVNFFPFEVELVPKTATLSSTSNVELRNPQKEMTLSSMGLSAEFGVGLLLFASAAAVTLRKAQACGLLSRASRRGDPLLS